MTKRISSKHKIDRRLKINLWGRPKSPFNTRAYGPGQHGQARQGKPSDYGIQLQAKQNLKVIMEILMRDNLEIFIKKLQCKKVILVKI